jgi:type IV pilus assembly protein PilM
MARKKNALGLDIGSSSVKLVQLRETKKGIDLVHFSMAPLPPQAIVDGALMQSSAIVEVVREMVGNLKLKTKEVAVSISGHSVIIKKIGLPAMTQDELDESIKWEAEQYIPFDVNDVYLDYQILQSRPEQGQMDVLLVAAKKEIVDEYAGVVRDAGLEPVVVDVDCFTIQNTFETCYSCPPGEAVVLIDIGAATININIISNGITTFTRDISMGGNQYTEELRKRLKASYEEAEAYKLGGREGVDADSVVPREVERIMASVSETIASELHRSLDFYLATSSEGRVSRIYLSGGTANVSSLAPTIANRVGVEVELLDPFKAVTVDPKRFNLDFINRVRPAAAVAVGLGLRGPNDR